MAEKTIVLAVLLAALCCLGYAKTSTCTRAEFTAVKRKIKRKIRSSPERDRWPARLLRVGFHDCFPGKCDGSIALQEELDRPDNDRVDMGVRFLQDAIKGTCCGIADAVKLGLELSSELTHGPRFRCRRGRTKDAATPNPDGNLPGVTETFNELLAKFQAQGFSKMQMLASNFAGHSLGQFVAPAPGAPVFTFDSTPTKLDKAFLRFVVRNVTRPGTREQFAALPSGLTLFNGARRETTRLLTQRRLLKRVFRRFMSKLCRL